MDFEDELELSPRFVTSLLRGGTGVGVLQRAHDELTRRAHNVWLETGRSDDKANWEDAERTLVRWRRQPDSGSEEENTGLDAFVGSPSAGSFVDFAGSRDQLAESCITLEANLHAAKAALQQEKWAVRALRKDLQAERARSKRFSFKLMAAEAQLYNETSAKPSKKGHPRTLNTRKIPALTALNGSKNEWREVEHYPLTPRARVRRRLYSSPAHSSCSSDCEACEISSAASGCHTPTASWWYDDENDDSATDPDHSDLCDRACISEAECSDSWWFSEDSTQHRTASEGSNFTLPANSSCTSVPCDFEQDADMKAEPVQVSFWDRDSLWLGSTYSAIEDLLGRGQKNS
ncbi:unnamed protein product [Symbiodinium pilosum]|uniref:Uncharacterized protein n=1 Tax=Symbiodinium pilosum TaxID=2952 RepID=A0A812VGZ0_SYMPI|nr:unnamed protein product [Symbiodinium pilosum]